MRFLLEAPPRADCTRGAPVVASSETVRAPTGRCTGERTGLQAATTRATTPPAQRWVEWDVSTGGAVRRQIPPLRAGSDQQAQHLRDEVPPQVLG
ncbi:hypothetical protein Pd630_LPD03228 [Rhodococcus opacus PD630]|nr:hypothetical protein Pd630_LPD03228 [Rhodococcus opacus PD630]